MRQPDENRFNIKGEKEIKNTIKVNFNSAGLSVQRLELYNLNARLKSGYKLYQEEEYKYIGYQLHYNPESIPKEVLDGLIDPGTNKLKEEIRFYQLQAEFFDATSDNPVMNDELKDMLQKRGKEKIKILMEELKRSAEKLKNIGEKYNDNLKSIISLCLRFEDEVLLPYELPIWLDFERFIHIYVRHVKETKVGERYDDKTIFQYKFRDVRRIIKAVLKSVYIEIQEHFKNNPNSNFYRIGERSVYYDGNYYRIEIEPNGRLLTFHPYNDNEAHK